MAKIQSPRLTNATPQYNPDQINQMIRTLEQMILTLNTNFTQESEDKTTAQSWFMMRGDC